MERYVVIPNEVVDKLNLSALGIVMALKGRGLEKFTYIEAQNLRLGMTVNEFKKYWQEMEYAGIIKLDKENDVNSLYRFTF